ncbi:MAG TPA: HI0074 family nucleotidyltransferase substrate-binding subunit [Candidatus Sumerlaeota bacterium]|nr:HI0074 family nucleotidyltransferase substrate-binding subunit [Candidatus Sumerlaeota bacterium]
MRRSIHALEVESLELAIEALRRALDTAQRHEDTPDDALRETLQAGVIQNFKVAYEQSWKFMQRWLRENLNAEEANFPRSRKDLFRMAARQGLVSDPLPWFEFAEARNLTSHTYDAGKAASGYETARRFLPFVEEFLFRLKERND